MKRIFGMLLFIVACKASSKKEINEKNTDSISTSRKHLDESFMELVLAPSRSFIVEEKCNYLHVHLIAKPTTHNKDSLTRAVAILTNDYWKTIHFSEDCNPNVRCGVYLYEETADGKDPLQGGWILAGTKITGWEPDVLISNYWK